MNLNNLKPAWRQFRLLNSMQSIDRNEILAIIERAEEVSINTTHRYIISAVVFTVLVISCQGG